MDFNQGVDARILAKSPMFLREMATIAISPLRIAFDHAGLRKVYDRAVRDAAQNGITSLSNYMLYNFMDSPQDLYHRMKLNIDLNLELGIRIWSFPMRYQPVDLKDRSHVGAKWNRYILRSLQVILQATRGVVTGNPSFFTHAYGHTPEEFEQMLTLPHAFIFHRDHFASGPGEPLRREYEQLRQKLSPSQQQELIHILSQTSPQDRRPYGEHLRRNAADSTIDPTVRRALRYHILDTKERSRLWPDDLLRLFEPPLLPPEDQMTEDAGITDDPC